MKQNIYLVMAAERKEFKKEAKYGIKIANMMHAIRTYAV